MHTSMDQERHMSRGDACTPICAPPKVLGCAMGRATRMGAGTQAARWSPSLPLCVGVPCKQDPTGMGPCYGRLAVVSDLDNGGFALNVDKELRGSAVL
jgi:hypothetical protein